MRSLIGCVALLVLVGLTGGVLVYLALHHWWVLLLLVVAILLLRRHPGVRAARQMREVVGAGEQQRDQVKHITAQALADMTRIARHRKTGQ